MDEDEIVREVIEHLQPGGGGLGRDSALDHLDSLAIIDLITFLEERFGLTLRRADLRQLTTPGRIAELVVTRSRASS